jgi:hypothetical protein
MSHLDAVEDAAAEAVQTSVDVIPHERLRLLHEVLDLAGGVVDNDAVLRRLGDLGHLQQ